MSDILARIKRAVLRGRIRFTEKSLVEIQVDSLSEEDVAESLMNATAICKSIRSTSPAAAGRREYLHIILSYSHNGTLIYSKGKLDGPPDAEWFYLLISAKRDI
jgi:hypothetical protein